MVLISVVALQNHTLSMPTPKYDKSSRKKKHCEPTLVVCIHPQQMDGDVYEDLRSHFVLLCGTEMDACMAIHKQYSGIWESVTKVGEYIYTVYTVVFWTHRIIGLI